MFGFKSTNAHHTFQISICRNYILFILIFLTVMIYSCCITWNPNKIHRIFQLEWDNLKWMNEYKCNIYDIYNIKFSGWCLKPHQSAVLHVFLQPLHSFPAHTFTFGTRHSPFGHNLELPALLLASWRRSTARITIKSYYQRRKYLNTKLTDYLCI